MSMMSAHEAEFALRHAEHHIRTVIEKFPLLDGRDRKHLKDQADRLLITAGKCGNHYRRMERDRA